MRVEDLKPGDTVLIPKRSSYREEAGDYMVRSAVYAVESDGATVAVKLSDGRWISRWFFPVGAEITKVEAW